MNRIITPITKAAKGNAMTTRVLSIGSLLLAGTALLSQPALAQTIDYAALAGLFGEPVTTSATGKPQRVSEAPVTMEIITADQIRQSGATNIPQILQQVPGLDVWATNSTSQNVGIRGLNRPFAAKLLVLINGRHVYGDDFNQTNWLALPVEINEIEQIEIVKGPNTALFGFNALSGVINIITRSPLHSDLNVVSGRLGTEGDREVSMSKTLRLGPSAAVRLSAGFLLTDQFGKDGGHTFGLPPSQDQLTDDINARKAKRRNVGLDGMMQLTPSSQFRVEGSWTDAQTAQTWPTWDTIDHYEEQYTLRGTYSADTSAGLITASAYMTNHDIDTTSAVVGGPSIYHNRIYVGKVENLLKPDASNTFRVFGEYRHNGLYGNNIGPASGGSHLVKYSTLSGGGMWDRILSPTLTLTNALRIDHVEFDREGPIKRFIPYTNDDYKRTLNPVSFNSGLVWRPTTTDTVRLSAARGVQLPSLIEVGLQQNFGADDTGQVPPLLLYGVPTLPVTTLLSGELGYDRHLTEQGAVLRTALFVQQLKGNRDFTVIPVIKPNQPVLLTLEHSGSSKVHGAEIGLRSDSTAPWRWAVSYTFTDVSDTPYKDPTVGLNHQSLYGPTNSKHKLNANLGYSVGAWEADIFLNWVSRRQAFTPWAVNLTTIPDYTLVNTRIGYRLTDDITLSLQGFNLVDDGHTQLNGPEVDRRVTFATSIRF